MLYRIKGHCTKIALLTQRVCAGNLLLNITGLWVGSYFYEVVDWYNIIILFLFLLNSVYSIVTIIISYLNW